MIRHAGWLAALPLLLCASQMKIDINEVETLYQGIATTERNSFEPRINQMRDPFFIPSKTTITTVEGNETLVVVEPPLELQAVVVKRAKIDGQWYQKGDLVHTYKVAKISNERVWLHSLEMPDKNKILSLSKPQSVKVSK